MLSPGVGPDRRRAAGEISRRDWVRVGGLGLAGLSLDGLLRLRDASAATGPPRGRARSAILLFLSGGPAHMDMWDPKPDAPDGIRSLFAPIDTVVPGIRFTDQLPRMARHADKMCIVRSFTHPSNQHVGAVEHPLQA